MSREQKGNHEPKKKPQMTMKEKRAMKKGKKEDKSFLSKELPQRKGPPQPVTRRP